MNNIQKFNNFLKDHANPYLDKIKIHVDGIRCFYDTSVNTNLASGHLGSSLFTTMLKSTPIALCIFATISSLSTPALFLAGATATAAFITQPDLLTEQGKIRLVAASLNVTLLFTSVKVLTAIAALDLGAIFLLGNIAAAASLGLYAGYQWLLPKPQVQ